MTVTSADATCRDRGLTTTDLGGGPRRLSSASSILRLVETLPQPSRDVPLAVDAGDTVTVSLVQGAAGEWSLTIRNATSGGVYNGTVTYASSASSAEWIEEAPSAGKGVVLLDQFGSVRFTNATAVKDGQTVTPAAAGVTAVTMVTRSGVTLASPSDLGSDGASFTVTRG